MLSYTRSKSIGVQKQSENLRVVSGVLEDELYAMQCEMAIDWPSRTIQSVQARLKRYTTIKCPMAETVFEGAEGWPIDSTLETRIKKELGRNGCRHMAILMVDCCQAVVRSELVSELEAALTQNPDLDKKAFTEDFLAREPDLRDYIRLV
jgi:hypothetical protein